MSVATDIHPSSASGAATARPVGRRNRPWRRALRIVQLEMGFQIRRPLLIVLVLVLGFTVYGLTSGFVHISTGDQTVGGKQAYITSEHANTLTLCILTFLYYTFFIAVASGMALPRDEELRVGEILLTTGLRLREYVWGKLAGIVASFVAVLALQLVLMAIVYHLVPYEQADKVRGPFAVMNYVRPAFVVALPVILFMAGFTFLLGERTRRPVLVFLFPVALVLGTAFFLWSWSPSWLDPRLNRWLMLVDLSGYRWLNEMQLKVDRGVDYYNARPVAYDAAFVLSRIAFVLLGLAAVSWSERHFARSLRAAHRMRGGVQDLAAQAAAAPSHAAAPEEARLADLGMRRGAPDFLHQAWTIARVELRNLASSPGLYLFAPLILQQAIQAGYYADSVWGTRLLVTPGAFTAQTFDVLTLCIVLLLLFYTVESFDRERGSGLRPIYDSTAVRTGAVLLGKALANCFVAVVILAAAWIGCFVIVLAQGQVRMEMRPFAIVWGLLLVPTFLLWSSFVMALMAATGNKFTTYALALAALVLTGVQQARGKMNWAWNWDLWSAVRWSDLGTLEPNAWPLLLNRLLALGLALFFIVLTVQLSGRREFDATRLVHRLSPGALLRRSVRLLPYVLPLAVLAGYLGLQVWGGFQSKAARKRDRDYWKQNLATWRGAPLPALASVDLDLSFEPSRHLLHSRGTYALVNIDAEPLRQVALTLATHIRDPKWKLNGADCTPENRSNLFVFTPPRPLARGDTVRIGFDYATRWPDGITRNGGGLQEFVEPSGVVLTGFRPILAPVVGYMEEIGREEKENGYEPRVYPDDWYRRELPAAFNLRKSFPTRIRIEGPQEYTYNSVGTLTEDRVEGGRRIVTWTSDHPMTFFNVVAGKWAVRRGEGTAIYYHPKHTYNIDEMSRALDASRRWYSEWFCPYPWQELKVSEFANLAQYAQGFGTNITFSEGIGFLTRSDAHTKVAFAVTAHEAAHQWWGNMLVPAEGPGGDILSEGMAHFSTLMLHEQVYGPQARIEFAKRIEERYGEQRHVDAERPLVKIDGSKAGDKTVMYDKGGWVFWMLQDLMGRDANLAGLRVFLDNHLTNPDHPLLEDFVAEMRPFAADSTAYDAFTKQWFFEVVVPEYRFENVKRAQEGGRWTLTGTLHNSGSGTMPVEVAATRGERFVKQTSEQAAREPALVSKDYQETRRRLVLGAGQSSPFRLECAFEPQLVLADPDAHVLQLRRKNALRRF